MYGDACYQVTNFSFNTLKPRQNGRHFADDIFKCIFLNENAWILIKISLKFVHKGSINNIPALFQIMAWRRPGDKPLSEPMLVRIPTHICVTRPQWVNDCENICTARNYHHQVGNMNHQPLFRVRNLTIVYALHVLLCSLQQISKLRVTGLCEGNSPVNSRTKVQ